MSLIYTDEEKKIVKQIVTDTINELDKTMNYPNKDLLIEGLYKMEIEGKVAKEVLGVETSRIEDFYRFGYNLFKSGKYNDASLVFGLLFSINPLDSRFSLAQGACYQNLEEWEKAINSYMASAIVDSQSPLGLYYASDCYLKLNQPACALGMLSAVLTRCGDRYECNVIKHTSIIIYERLCKELNVTPRDDI